MKILGYIFGILGLIALVYIAYIYLSGSFTRTLSIVAALLLCIIGAVMISRSKKRTK